MDEKTVKQRTVTFYENGRFSYEGFSSLWELYGFLQANIFTDWQHPVFQNIMKNTEQEVKQRLEADKNTQKI